MVHSSLKPLPLANVPTILMLLMFSTTLVVEVLTPCLPDIRLYYNCSEAELRSILPLMSLGSFLTIPVFGPLSDSWGRKKILIFSQIIFSLGLVIALCAPSVLGLGVARFLQGIGSSGASSVSFAVITDLYPSQKRATYFSYLIACLTSSLVIGPLLGAFFQYYISWKAGIFLILILALLNLMYLIKLPESLKNPQPFSIFFSLKQYIFIFRNPVFLGYALLAPLMIGGIVSYGINGSFYFINHCLMTPQQFSYHQALIMIANTTGAIFAGRAVPKLGEYFILRCAMGFVAIFATTGLIIISRNLIFPPWAITAIVSIFALGLGGSSAILSCLAMKIFPGKVGILTSALSLLRTFGVGLGIIISGKLYNNTSYSILIYLCIISIVVVSLFFILQRYFLLQSENESVS